jgi:hypothetical protein
MAIIANYSATTRIESSSLVQTDSMFHNLTILSIGRNNARDVGKQKLKLNMKKLIILLLLVSASVFAQKGAVGIIFGEPTGLSGKINLSQQHSITTGLAWSTVDDKYIHIHADYLWNWKPIVKILSNSITPSPITLYIGTGIRFRSLQTDSRLGIRGVAGCEYDMKPVPFEIFAEVAPIMDMLPKTELKFNGGIGLRMLIR